MLIFINKNHKGPSKWEENRVLKGDTKVESLFKPAGEDKNLITIEAMKEKTGIKRRSFYISCEVPNKIVSDHSYKVRFISSNAGDKKLPDPVELEANMIVSCKTPYTLQIYLWKINEAPLDINTVGTRLSREVSIRNDQTHYFQTWVFDKNNNPFYNFSTLKITWEKDTGAEKANLG